MGRSRWIRAGILAGLALVSAPGAQPEPGWRGRVLQAPVLAVATLLTSCELTASGVDHGRGLLQVERVLYPPGMPADRLVLRWTNPSARESDRVDPRTWLERESIWLLVPDPDGAVRMLDRGSAVPLDDIDATEQLAASQWPLEGPEHELKALAIEEFLEERRGDPVGHPPPSPFLDPPFPHEKIEFALRDYRRFPPHKAFAVAHDGEGRWSYEYVFGESDDHAARLGALRACSVRAATNRVKAPCRLHALNDELVTPAGAD